MLDNEQSENVEIIEEEVVEAEAEAELDVDGETPEQPDEEPEEATEDDELIVNFDGEDANPDDELFNPKAPEAPEWVRDLRKNYREEKKRAKELEKRLAELEEAKKPTLGPKPTLEGCEYDTGKFEAALEKWHETKRSHDAEQAEQKTVQQKAQEVWESDLGRYQEAKTGLKVRDYEDAEEAVQDTLSVTQQGMIVSGAENPALLVYALGKSPQKLNQLAGITDPVKFAFAVARMETQLKISSRKPASAPEKKISGSASSSGANATLEKLRSEAERTGNYTKVHAYRRQMKSAAKS